MYWSKHSLRELYGLNEDRISYLIWHSFFGEDKQIVDAKVQISIQKEEFPQVFAWLQNHSFLMCDISQTFSSLGPECVRTCYHSLVLSINNWENFNIAHISDLHIAQRFDELLVAIEHESPLSNMGIAKPLIERYRNPNNYLRKFIHWVNMEAQKGKLDCIVATGDLIDYYLKNTIPKQQTYEMEESNWQVFMNIILNLSSGDEFQQKKNNLVSQVELNVPMFTQTGNHDVRVNGYPLNAATGIYRNFGLTMLESKSYKDPFSRNQIQALKVDKYCLKPYYEYINPFDDFFLKFGKVNLIFLNSGADTYLDFQSLLMGDPAAVGFSKKQVEFVKNITKNYVNSEEDLNILFSHAPVLNPEIKNPLFRAILKIFRKDVHIPRNNFRESRIGEGNQAMQQLIFKYGGINNNWLNFLGIMYENRMFGFHGHTHMHWETRFQLSAKRIKLKKKTKEEIKSNPFKFYLDDYSEILDSDEIRKKRPFDIQIPSLGIGKHSENIPPGKFRLIKIRDNRIESMQIITLK